jgi:hypothetical protein
MPVLEERKRHAGLRDDDTVEEFEMDKISESVDDENRRYKDTNITLV